MSAEQTPPVVAATEPSPATESSKPAAESKNEAAAATPETSPNKVAEEKPKPQEEKPKVPEKSVEKSSGLPEGPLQKLAAELPALIKETGHGEMWGVELSSDPNHVPTSIILEKFLRANNKVVPDAAAQLKKALVWRKEMKPRALLEDVEFDKSKFGDLGFVTVYPQPDGLKEIVTWNVYGAVKDNKKTFGDVQEFVKWRAALMELSLKELDLGSATVKITENGVDPYRMIQVHDYLSVSFLRMDPTIKAASKQTIETFSMAYPELVKEKFFVNVPLLMGWVFTAMKLILSPATIKKFHPLSYGSSLAGQVPFGHELPAAYGGKGKDVKEGLTVRYAGEGQKAAPVVTEPVVAKQEPATKQEPVVAKDGPVVAKEESAAKEEPAVAKTEPAAKEEAVAKEPVAKE